MIYLQHCSIKANRPKQVIINQVIIHSLLTFGFDPSWWLQIRRRIRNESLWIRKTNTGGEIGDCWLSIVHVIRHLQFPTQSGTRWVGLITVSRRSSLISHYIIATINMGGDLHIFANINRIFRAISVLKLHQNTKETYAFSLRNLADIYTIQVRGCSY